MAAEPEGAPPGDSFVRWIMLPVSLKNTENLSRTLVIIEAVQVSTVEVEQLGLVLILLGLGRATTTI